MGRMVAVFVVGSFMGVIQSKARAVSLSTSSPDVWDENEICVAVSMVKPIWCDADRRRSSIFYGAQLLQNAMNQAIGRACWLIVSPVRGGVSHALIMPIGRAGVVLC